MNSVKRHLFLIGGGLCVFCALVGILVPVLPTTPFLLLAVFLFAHSSQRAHDWVLNNRWFGGYIRRYHEGHGIALRDKIFTLALLWLTILLSVFLLIERWPVQLLLLAIAMGVTVHLVRTKTYRPQDETSKTLPFSETD